MALKNKFIKDMFEKVNGKLHDFHNLICKVCDKDPSDYNASSVYWRGKQVIQTAKNLNKYKDKTRYSHFLESDFQFPRTAVKRKNTSEYCNNCKKLKLDKENSDILISELNKKLLFYKDKSRNPYAVKQKLKRKDATIKRLKGTIANLKERIAFLSCKPVQCSKGIQCNTIKSVINDFQLQVDSLILDKEETDENNNSESIYKVFGFRENIQGRPYSSILRQLYYFLQSHNVPLQNISKVIREVLSLVGVEVTDLPSIATASKLTTELGIVSRKHISETISPAENITMHRDATTKKGRHFYGVELSTEIDKTLTAGLREIKDGKGETYFQTTMDTMNDISGNRSEDIISKLSNFMTDRSATEQKVNNLLIKDRKERLGVDDTVNCFKCSVHPLLQFADVCQKEIKVIEKEYKIHSDSISKNESVTLSLLRFMSKLFQKDGSGDPLLSTIYLQSAGIKKVPIKSFKGNRFNVMFYNAAGTNFLKDQIITYLTSSKSSLNFMQSFILQHLQDKEVLSIFRSLGLICKFVTEPYFERTGKIEECALNLKGIYQRFVKVVGVCKENPDNLLKGQIKLFEGLELPTNEETLSLLSTTNTDSMTSLLIKRFCSSLHLKAKHLFSDFLTDGKFHNPSENLIKSSQSCPPNNISMERDMAQLDCKLKSAPSLNANSIESTIMFKKNDTSSWLKSKSETELCSIITETRKENTKMLRKMKEDKLKLFNSRVQIIKEREESIRLKNDKKKQKKCEALEYIKEKGLWESEEKIREEVAKLRSKKEKINALKQQINLYKTVFSIASEDKHLLLFSHKGKIHDVDTLTNNLSKLIQKRINENSTDTNCINNKLPHPSSLVGKKFFHVWTDNDVDTTWEGTILSYENEMFKVIYESDEQHYYLTKEEFELYFQEGSLHF